MRADALMILLLILSLVFTSCSWEEELGEIKRPDKPNVLKYATQEEARLYRHKLSPSLYRYGVPGYLLRNSNDVEVIVKFTQGAEINWVKSFLTQLDATLVHPSNDEYTVIISEHNFWELVEHQQVQYVRIASKP